MKQRIITGVLLIIGVVIFIGLGGLPLQLMCALIAVSYSFSVVLFCILLTIISIILLNLYHNNQFYGLNVL